MIEKSKKIKKTKVENKVPEITIEQFFSTIEPKPEGVKHLITCKCFLPQFKNHENPPIHRFIVFSELDEYANVKPSFVECNNCGIVHKVLEIEKSAITNKESVKAVENIDEVLSQVPEWLYNLLKKYECDLPTCQEARFIIQNKLWGRFVVLDKERTTEGIFGKALIILGDRLHKIETFEREE